MQVQSRPAEFSYSPAQRAQKDSPLGNDAVDFGADQVTSSGIFPYPYDNCTSAASDVRSGDHTDVYPCTGAASDVRSGGDLGPCMGAASDVKSGTGGGDVLGCGNGAAEVKSDWGGEPGACYMSAANVKSGYDFGYGCQNGNSAADVTSGGNGSPGCADAMGEGCWNMYS